MSDWQRKVCWGSLSPGYLSLHETGLETDSFVIQNPVTIYPFRYHKTLHQLSPFSLPSMAVFCIIICAPVWQWTQEHYAGLSSRLYWEGKSDENCPFSFHEQKGPLGIKSFCYNRALWLLLWKQLLSFKFNVVIQAKLVTKSSFFVVFDRHVLMIDRPFPPPRFPHLLLLVSFVVAFMQRPGTVFWLPS